MNASKLWHNTKRLLATLFDLFVIHFFTSIGNYSRITTDDSPPPPFFVEAPISFWVLWLLYASLMEHSKYSATLGKRLFRLYLQPRAPLRKHLWRNILKSLFAPVILLPPFCLFFIFQNTLPHDFYTQITVETGRKTENARPHPAILPE